MQIYLVGGAVRDTLLGLQVKEKDWVVVGGSVDDMLKLGFKPVGKDFPVFLHPKTHEEYALARSERKTKPGYKGFVFHADPSVKLEEDLKRRDLTINAIAQDEDGNLIDPFNGQQDLKNKTLHHVSPAFSEDPVRLLRLARFAAKLPDFTIHPETFAMLQTMVANGEVDALVPERVCQELTRAFGEQDPSQATALLHECHAWNKLFPMLAGEFKQMQSNLKSITNVSKNSTERFASWCANLKPEVITELSQHLKVANEYSDLAKTCSYLMSALPDINPNIAENRLDLIERADGLRRAERFQTALKICAALGCQDISPTLKRDLETIKNLDLNQTIAAAKQNNADIKFAVRNARLTAISD